MRHDRHGPTPTDTRGFTLIELMIVTLILALLAALVAPKLQRAHERGRIAGAIGDIKTLEAEINERYTVDGAYPADLAALDRDGLLDPWGNPYRYLPVDAQNVGLARKDRFLVPLNSDYDLYSMGPDGRSASAITAATSIDDVIRANDGSYVGPAAGY